MTPDGQDAQTGRDDIGSMARRLIHAYHSVLDRGDEVLPSLSDPELAAVREMLMEMWDSFTLMRVGNLVIFIDEEIARRAAATARSNANGEAGTVDGGD